MERGHKAPFYCWRRERDYAGLSLPGALLPLNGLVGLIELASELPLATRLSKASGRRIRPNYSYLDKPLSSDG